MTTRRMLMAAAGVLAAAAAFGAAPAAAQTKMVMKAADVHPLMLAQRAPQVGADAPQQSCRVFLVGGVDRQAAQQGESAAFLEFVQHPRQLRLQSRQTKVIARELRGTQAPGAHGRHRAAQLVDLRSRQAPRP